MCVSPGVPRVPGKQEEGGTCPKMRSLVLPMMFAVLACAMHHPETAAAVPNAAHIRHSTSSPKLFIKPCLPAGFAFSRAACCISVRLPAHLAGMHGAMPRDIGSSRLTGGLGSACVGQRRRVWEECKVACMQDDKEEEGDEEEGDDGDFLLSELEQRILLEGAAWEDADASMLVSGMRADEDSIDAALCVLLDHEVSSVVATVPAALSAEACKALRAHAGTQCTCCTSTTAQILTQQEERRHAHRFLLHSRRHGWTG